MNFQNLSQKIGSLTFALLLLTGITLFSTTTAEAQQRRVVRRPVIIVRPIRVYRPFYRPFGWYNRGWYHNSWHNPYSQYVFDNSEEAAREGFEEGYETGEEDGRKNKSFSYERSDHYKDAGFGNFGEVYRRNFARGYQGGYEEGAAKAAAKAREKAAKERAKLAEKAAKKAAKDAD